MGTRGVAALDYDNDIVDWVLIELRSEINGDLLSQNGFVRAALLTSNVDVIDIDGSNNIKFWGIPADSYFIVVKHRNHLPIISSTRI